MVGPREPDQPAFEVPRVQAAFSGQLGEAGKIWVGMARAEEAKVQCTRHGARIERGLSARPHSPELTQEQLDGHWPPAGQGIQSLAQLGVGGETLADHGGLPVVTLTDHLRQGLQPGRRTEVIAGVAAFVEEGDQVVLRYVAGLADPCQASTAEHTECAFRHRSRDTGPEQGGRHEPPLDLRIPGVNVDSELSRKAPAQRLYDLPGQPDAPG